MLNLLFVRFRVKPGMTPLGLDLTEQHPIRLSLLLQREGVGAGGGGHAPEAEGVDAHPAADGRDGTVEGLGGEGAGFLARGDEGVAVGDAGQQGRDVRGGDDLQEGVGGVVFEAAYLACGVVEREAGVGAELPDPGFVETLFAWHAEMILFPEVDDAHDTPEVVDPVGVVERHAPAVRLGREAAQEQDARALRQEGFEGVLLYGRLGGHRLEDLRGGVLRVDFLDDALEGAVFIEDEGAAERAEDRFPVHFLFAPGAEGLQHLGRGVGEQAERQLEFGLETRMRGGAVLAHAHDVVAGGRELRIIVPEGAGLGRAAGGVVLGVEVDDGLAALADKVLGLNRLSVLVHHLEVGHLVSDLEHIILLIRLIFSPASTRSRPRQRP